MDIGNYSRKVIEKYKESQTEMATADAKKWAVGYSASNASSQDRVSINNAAKVARHAIEAYETKRAGLGDGRAMEEAVKATASRFDDRARDLAKSHERSRSSGLGL